jgi:hypothetical protein
MYHIVEETNGVGRRVYALYFAGKPTGHTGYRYAESVERLQALMVGMSYL